MMQVTQNQKLRDSAKSVPVQSITMILEKETCILDGIQQIRIIFCIFFWMGKLKQVNLGLD